MNITILENRLRKLYWGYTKIVGGKECFESWSKITERTH
jgi:hypothetical protein